MDTEDLQFSLEATIASIKFYEDINQIHLIVEDKGKESEYETIFKRLLKEQYNIEKIFAVGGKLNVKKCYEELKNEKSLYVIFLVDGDFDRYKDPRGMINDKRFIYLETYNIESYFIDENACSMFVKSRTHLLDEDVEHKLRFKEWYSKIIGQAKDLFFIYCYLQIYNPQIPTIENGPYFFIDQKTGFKKEDTTFEQYKYSIYAQDRNAQYRINEIISIYKQLHGNDYSYLICGKFLFCSLKNYIYNILKKYSNNYSISDNEFRWYLIYNFETEKLSYVRDSINLVYPKMKLH